MERICRFNREVICDSAECYHCGWDPEVAKGRLEAIVRKESGRKLYKVPFTGFCEVWADSQEEAAEKAEDTYNHFYVSYDYGDPECLVKEEENEMD